MSEVIPKALYWDQLVLGNGDLLMIDFVSISDNGIKFRLKGEGEFLTIPIDRVKSLTSKVRRRHLSETKPERVIAEK